MKNLILISFIFSISTSFADKINYSFANDKYIFVQKESILKIDKSDFISNTGMSGVCALHNLSKFEGLAADNNYIYVKAYDTWANSYYYCKISVETMKTTRAEDL